jgi:Domain of unknown function (DUF4926)
MPIEIPLQRFNLLDVVAILLPLPDKDLSIGQVGTIVEILDADNQVFEIEFCDLQGRTIALCALQSAYLLKLEYTQASKKRKAA